MRPASPSYQNQIKTPNKEKKQTDQKPSKDPEWQNKSFRKNKVGGSTFPDLRLKISCDRQTQTKKKKKNKKTEIKGIK